NRPIYQRPSEATTSSSATRMIGHTWPPVPSSDRPTRSAPQSTGIDGEEIARVTGLSVSIIRAVLRAVVNHLEPRKPLIVWLTLLRRGLSGLAACCFLGRRPRCCSIGP